MKTKSAVNFWLVVVAIIWGVGFVPQKLGMEYLGPAAFNTWRFALGALTVLPVIFLLRRNTGRVVTVETWVLGGVLGLLLFMGALCQQLALLSTSVANVAFITGLYVILVPVIGYFFGIRYALIVWTGGLIAMIGLYLITGGLQGSAVKGDLIAIVGAVMWAAHIMVLSRFAGKHPQLKLSALQFLFCSLFSLSYALSFESIVVPTELFGLFWPLVNGGIVVGLAYTLQVILLEKADPFEASIIFSLEAVFGAIAGYFVFDESLTMAGLVGASMMLVGCVLAQVPGAKAAHGEAG